MKVLVACEFSGIVRDAFAAKGHDAWSCDLLPTERPGNHIQGDVLGILDDGWDLMIAHPPCTYLSNSGARWLCDPRHNNRAGLQLDAIAFVEKLWLSRIEKVAIENPVGILSTRSRLGKSTQTVEPSDFGHPTNKRTCLWLRWLPKLYPTNIVEPDIVRLTSGKRMSRWYVDTSSITLKDGLRGKIRSITFQGIADAMAEQWG